MIVKTQACGDVADTRGGLICVAEWLAQLFLQPMDADRVAAARSPQGLAALRWMGESLDEPQAAEVICAELAKAEVTQVVVALQRRHTALFDGVFRQYGVLPYASAWDGTGR